MLARFLSPGCIILGRRVWPVGDHRVAVLAFDGVERGREVVLRVLGTGAPIASPGHTGRAEAKRKYHGYRYAGTDVRMMPPADVARLKKQLRRVKG